MLSIRQLFDPATSTFSYLLWDVETREAALIDSVREQVERDTTLIRELDLNLRFLLETHIHADHVTGSGQLREQFSAQVVVHRETGSDCADRLVDTGDVIELGEQRIEVLYTPGHTNGDISYRIDGAVFTGDALLIRGCGRTDFQSGDASNLYDSIHGKLFSLLDDTVVYPGHDYRGFTQSSIGEEKRFNPRLGNQRSREDFIALMDGLVLDPPQHIDEAVPGNMVCGLIHAA